ncbi:cytidine deaminase-like protein [Pelagophyceae sp. CCMP2097]|nr:cytidine deaminase-like protein [Pelagophyceae sp. CCMP2097]
MAHVISSVQGTAVDVVPIRRALLSVSDKTGVIELGQALAAQGVELLSTGGTAAALRGAGLKVTDVSDFTGLPEMLDGRVKTLHPKVHGGLLYVRGNATHEREAAEAGILAIDLVVLNLYAFEATVAKGSDFATCVENVDIGGPSMLRSSAKNHAYVTIATSPQQYAELATSLASVGGTPYALRRKFAAAAFALSAKYDASIAAYFAEQEAPPATGPEVPALSTRTYTKQLRLKYGCNPHQLPAALCSVGDGLPFTVRNGAPGYINMLDALNAYQLVSELRRCLDLPAAASFKHVSPAGAALGVPLSAADRALYEIAPDVELTPLATAYVRARQADPMCSFGDFVALSDRVDAATARILQKEVSDGCIAPGYDDDALAILSAKKGGKFVAIEMDPSFVAPDLEYREVAGVVFVQKRNDTILQLENVSKDACANDAQIPLDKQRDLALASIACKYTQSNSVAYALDGMLVGVGAGQQSRVDCVKLAARKMSTWWLRQIDEVRDLPFKAGTKRQDKVNARVRYIEGDFTPAEQLAFDALFESPPAPLTEAAKKAHLAKLTGVCLASDAFFPFRDNIDVAARFGVKYISQAGGSVQDDAVVGAAREHGIAMALTGLRLFHH